MLKRSQFQLIFHKPHNEGILFTFLYCGIVAYVSFFISVTINLFVHIRKVQQPWARGSSFTTVKHFGKDTIRLL